MKATTRNEQIIDPDFQCKQAITSLAFSARSLFECAPPTLDSPGLVGVCLAARALKRKGFFGGWGVGAAPDDEKMKKGSTTRRNAPFLSGASAPLQALPRDAPRQVSEREPQSTPSLCGWQLGSRGSGMAARMAGGRWPDAGKARPKLSREECQAMAGSEGRPIMARVWRWLMMSAHTCVKISFDVENLASMSPKVLPDGLLAPRRRWQGGGCKGWPASDRLCCLTTALLSHRPY